ncbi:hypothetical protein EPI10_011333 [Gossypium australe]|uniref:Uncharacterized protein n=1 Tax=Gossypium australe TaxID=47621 RepID=A0A5B6W8J7_9ROSI|nr:hypothetical protein EPI10_011333 [Gossypium australe]
MFKSFFANGFNANTLGQQPSQFEIISCIYCRDDHISGPGSNLNYYTSSWKNHLNFSWSNQGAGLGNSYMPSHSNNLLRFSQQMQKPQLIKSLSSLENLLKAYMAKTDATLRNLENQMRQLANELTSRPQGALPTDIVNPRNTCK